MRSPGRARRTTIVVAGEAFVIERVHRLTELEQHVIGDVDDIADGADAGGSQPVRQPLRGRADLYLEHLGAVTRAEIGSLDRHIERHRRSRLRHGDVRHLDGQRPDRGRFARDADVAHAIGTVGSDLEVDHCVGPGSIDATSNPRRLISCAMLSGLPGARTRSHSQG